MGICNFKEEPGNYKQALSISSMKKFAFLDKTSKQKNSELRKSFFNEMLVLEDNINKEEIPLEKLNELINHYKVLYFYKYKKN